jgi:hypothetical protein
MKYQDMRMEFRDKKGQRVTLRGMSTWVPMIISKKRMKAIFGHKDMACVAECLITMQKPLQDYQHYHVDIQALLGKNDRVVEPLPAGRPPDRGFEHVIELEEGENPMINL